MKCESHMEIEVCLGLGCAKNGVVVAQRYEVIGETCKYLYSYEVAQKLKLRNHRSPRVMNGELNSILESGLQKFVLARTEERLIL